MPYITVRYREVSIVERFDNDHRVYADYVFVLSALFLLQVAVLIDSFEKRVVVEDFKATAVGRFI